MNWSSPVQLRELLYKKLNLPVLQRTKTGASTSNYVLEKLKDKHPLIPLILDFRKYTKLYTTYTHEWIKKIHPSDKRLHAQIIQTGTDTGRISMKTPNLQQIPKQGEIAEKIRRAVIAEDGYSLIENDYSQCDLRVLAHESKDSNMVRAFCEGKDIHQMTAEMLGCERQKAKSVNFGLVYGKTSYGFSKDWDVPESDAELFLKQYFTIYPGVRAWMNSQIHKAKVLGYTTTFLGRKRYIHSDIKLPIKPFKRNDGSWGDSNAYRREAVERQVFNSPIQGGTADITKLAMIEVYKVTLRSVEQHIRLLVQIHDSIILECPDRFVTQVALRIKYLMENIVKLIVPLKVNVSAGKNLAEMKEIT